MPRIAGLITKPRVSQTRGCAFGYSQPPALARMNDDLEQPCSQTRSGRMRLPTVAGLHRPCVSPSPNPQPFSSPPVPEPGRLPSASLVRRETISFCSRARQEYSFQVHLWELRMERSFAFSSFPYGNEGSYTTPILACHAFSRCVASSVY